MIVEARAQGIPLDKFLQNKIVTDGAIGTYTFDVDGALQGIKFKIVKLQDGKEENLLQ